MPSPTDPKPRLVILDSHGILYRAFYGTSQARAPLATSKGELTGATFGYAESLLKVIEDLEPTHICAAWDAPGKTFRHEADDQYKATRRKTPDELKQQMERVRELLGAFGIPVFEAPGFEADDVAGTISRLMAEEGVETTIVTLDSDLVQLIRPEVELYMYRPARGGEVRRYDEEGARDRYGFSPPLMIDFKALQGDTSDNVPGVKGIGEKTATALVQQFGTVEEIYRNVELVEKERTRKLLKEGESEARRSKELVTIRTDLEIDFDLAACAFSTWDREAVMELFRELEFRSLIERLPGEGGAPPEPEVAAAEVEVVGDRAALEAMGAAVREAGACSVATAETASDGFHPLLLGVAFAAGEQAWYVPLRHAPRMDGESPAVTIEEFREVAGPLLAGDGVAKTGYETKALMHELAREEMTLAGATRDVSIMAFLLGETSSTVEALLNERLGVEVPPYSSLTGTGRKTQPLAQSTPEEVGAIAGRQAELLLTVGTLLDEQLHERGQWPLYEEMELPLVPVLFEMERAGITIDPEILSDLSDGMVADIEAAEKEIYAIAGREFNIGSPQQLGVVLFEEMELPKTRKTKQGYSTDQRALEGLREAHPIVDKIFEYRGMTKLKSTYLDALPGAVAPDGRIHTDFQQTVAATGRLSSTNPNLQNIPVRTEAGRDIRKAFVASGYKDPIYVSADYSQIELRVLAHVTGDKGLVDAFLADEDIHAATAASVYGIEPGDVTREMRDVAKMVNFGIAYGMGEFGLASRTGMSRNEAGAFISTYYERFPGIKAWQEETLETTREKGYGETVFGRRRYLPAINSRNFQVRSAAEREAINMPIQGAAADIIKVAMIRVAAEAKERGLESTMILQVHDELIFEGPESEADAVEELLRRVMPASYEMVVPLKVEVNRGARWSDLK